jgi:hypothetical protein
MIDRRDFLICASATLICAPAVVRAESLMPVRGVILPVQSIVPVRSNYYGFCDRLWIDSRYRSGELRGRSLINAVEQGLLRHIPQKQLASDIARWGCPAVPTGG